MVNSGYNGCASIYTGITATANGLKCAIGNPIIWTLNTSGEVITYTVCTSATIIKKITAGVAVGLGYPLAIIFTVTSVSSGIFATGPCTALAHLPNIKTINGFLRISLSPADTTIQLADAALCPYAASTCITTLALAIISYGIARCGRSAFVN